MDDCVKATLKTEFHEYATTHISPGETINDLVLRLQEICGSSLTLQNFRINDEKVNSSKTLLSLFAKGAENNTISKLSNKSFCRLCANNCQNMTDIFSLQIDYSEIIHTCLSINVKENDVLPTKICKTCISTLMEVYKFKQKTTEAELKLKSYFKCSDSLTSLKKASVMSDSNDVDGYVSFFSNNHSDTSNDLLSHSEGVDLEKVNKEETIKGEEKTLPCKWCNQSFNSVADLYQHSFIHNKASNFRKIHLRKKKMMKRPLIKQTCYLCVTCDQVFPVKPLLLQHRNSMHGTLDKNILTCGIVHMQRIYSCANCEVKYLGLKQLLKHLNKCTGSSVDNPFLQEGRRKLWRIPILKATKFFCEYCNVGFLSSRFYLRHRRGADAKDSTEKFSCTTCKRSFGSSCSLKWHEKQHDQTKEYICEVCGRTYSKLIVLRRHRIHHSAERPFSCGTCQKSFKTKVSLKGHERVHTGVKPYSCLTCGKRFKLSATLARHKKIHLDVRSHHCSICPSKFRTKCSLKLHLLTHTGQNPFTCSQCDASFRYRKAMMKHIQAAHPSLMKH